MLITRLEFTVNVCGNVLCWERPPSQVVDSGNVGGWIMLPDCGKFAEEWIASWNSHDLDRILSHYSEEVSVTTPMIQRVMGIASGTLSGKGLVRGYWEAALEKVPDLHFELSAWAQGVDSIALYYRAVMGKMAMEVMFFDGQGKVNKVVVHYH